MKHLYRFEFDGVMEEATQEAVEVGDNLLLVNSYEGLVLQRVLKRDNDGAITEYENIVDSIIEPLDGLKRLKIEEVAGMSVGKLFLLLGGFKRNTI